MAVELRAARLQSARHLSAIQSSKLNAEAHFCLDGSEGDEELRALFPCPFCYVDIEVAVLCTHLQEEHCFDVRNAVCPVCAENLGRDMIGHFTVQHVHMLKRRKPQRTALWSSAMLGKGARELSSFLGGASSTNSQGNTADSMPDPLLSPFLCGLTLPDAQDDQDATSGLDASVVSTPSNAKSIGRSTSSEDQEQDNEERRLRAEFVQQLIVWTIF